MAKSKSEARPHPTLPLTPHTVHTYSTVLVAKSKSDARLAGSLKRLGPVTPAVTPSSQSGGASGASPGGAGGSRPEKVIVFSQWTSMLDLLQVCVW